MTTLTEIKTAIEHLTPKERAILTAELFAMNDEPDSIYLAESADLQAALQRGLDDVTAGRVRPIEEIQKLIPEWNSKS